MSRPSALCRCVGDVAGFEHVWGRQPLYISRSDPATFADVFGLDAADSLLSTAIRTPAVRMVRDGETLAQHTYCTRTRIGGRHLDDVVDPDKVAKVLADGATLVLQSLHRICAPVGDLVGELQDELGHPVQANAYLTPPSAAGLAPHADGHDVIVLQLAGSKRWNVDGLGDVLITAGDSMYVPAGTTHSAHTGVDFSLHLTLGIIRVTPRAVLERVLAELDPLDAPLPIGYRHGEDATMRDAMARAMDTTTEFLAHADVESLVERERHRRLTPPIRRGLISSMLRSDEVDAETVVRWVAAPPRVRPAPAPDGLIPPPWRPIDDLDLDDLTLGGVERVVVHTGSRRLTVPVTTLEAIADLARSGPRSVGELPGLDAPSRVVLAQRLVRESICIIDP